ncbi:MAG: hypothetical protein J2P36_20545, partial [Ktedonobacteraceae bacterium]|nr:hypothetical protein [Ktedonobacteraceae bacterium]
MDGSDSNKMGPEDPSGRTPDEIREIMHQDRAREGKDPKDIVPGTQGDSGGGAPDSTDKRPLSESEKVQRLQWVEDNDHCTYQEIGFAGLGGSEERLKRRITSDGSVEWGRGATGDKEHFPAMDHGDAARALYNHLSSLPGSDWNQMPSPGEFRLVSDQKHPLQHIFDSFGGLAELLQDRGRSANGILLSISMGELSGYTTALIRDTYRGMNSGELIRDLNGSLREMLDAYKARDANNINRQVEIVSGKISEANHFLADKETKDMRQELSKLLQRAGWDDDKINQRLGQSFEEGRLHTEVKNVLVPSFRDHHQLQRIDDLDHILTALREAEGKDQHAMRYVIAQRGQDAIKMGLEEDLEPRPGSTPPANDHWKGFTSISREVEAFKARAEYLGGRADREARQGLRLKASETRAAAAHQESMAAAWCDGMVKHVETALERATDEETRQDLRLRLIRLSWDASDAYRRMAAEQSHAASGLGRHLEGEDSIDARAEGERKILGYNTSAIRSLGRAEHHHINALNHLEDLDREKLTGADREEIQKQREWRLAKKWYWPEKLGKQCDYAISHAEKAYDMERDGERRDKLADEISKLRDQRIDCYELCVRIKQEELE